MSRLGVRRDGRGGSYSGIGGQAVIEGIMMRNGEKYAVAVRKPDEEIEVEIQNHHGFAHGSVLLKIPFVRGVFNFADSLSLGLNAISYSASFYDEESQKDSNEGGNTGNEKAINALIVIFSIALAVGLFVVLPTYIASLIEMQIRNSSLLAIIEGVMRIVIFVVYLLAIGLLKDMRRLYAYHGAEHKCINCIEKGRPLTVNNVMKSSRFHRRCGTSFLFFIVFISILIFFFIRVENVWLRVGIRLLLVPVIAGIAYEILRLAGRYDNVFVRIISAPGKWIQHLTTREPDEKMVEVAIAAVEAVFDWKKYLSDTFGYEVTDSWMREDEGVRVSEVNVKDHTSAEVPEEVKIVEKRFLNADTREFKPVNPDSVNADTREFEPVDPEAVEAKEASGTAEDDKELSEEKK